MLENFIFYHDVITQIHDVTHDNIHLLTFNKDTGLTVQSDTSGQATIGLGSHWNLVHSSGPLDTPKCMGDDGLRDIYLKWTMSLPKL